MNKLVIGILAHVDAGKTTLSEGMLYLSGKLRKLGRVDKKDAFLDTYELERQRGITIFSKQAVMDLEDIQITLLDTPGHVDFSTEMERTLQVLDYAILVISGADGVQGHTETLWRLLSKYKIPVFLFINKMDQDGTDKDKLLEELKKRLDEGCTDFSDEQGEDFYESVAVCDEGLLEAYLETGKVEDEAISELIAKRQLFPCYFGSALKLEGVKEFMAGISKHAKVPEYPESFGAKVFKIARDEQGNRLTYMKIIGGSLKVRSVLTKEEEKVNQIRIYSGNKFDAINEALPGTVCAVTGLTKTYPGEGLGNAEATNQPLLEPVLTYQIILPDQYDPAAVLPKLLQLSEEDPQLHIVWDEALQEIQAQIMGEVQIEILKHMILERFGIDVSFGAGNIVYKETITNAVEGVGHFEPLRHYAEVHLLMEPLPQGSGVQFATDCSEDNLGKNWQRLVLTHLQEKEHKGVLTGSVITDMKITLVSGRAHNKHTEGGDFREATYRAVRQGLKQAQSILLEPFYEFRLEIPENMVGRAMMDVEKMCGKSNPPDIEKGMAILTGTAPVVTMRDYQKEVIAYTKGHGRLFCSLKGYEPCHNAEEVISAYGYDSEADIDNPTGSVFCAHGSGFLVSWDRVYDYMHIECRKLGNTTTQEVTIQNEAYWEEESIGTDEIDAILERTFYSNQKKEYVPRKRMGKRNEWATQMPIIRTASKPTSKEEYLLVDGYNVIFGCEELNETARTHIDAAKDRLLDLLCNYQGYHKCHLMVVFDAYRLEGHPTEIYDYHNIRVVYTKEAETADQFIEKFAHEHASKYRITVATSDGTEQIITRGKGCYLLSAKDLYEQMALTAKKYWEEYEEKNKSDKNYLIDNMPENIVKQMEEIRMTE
ncbi:TetM/TetW/TetO/TetS family tetracycline resistance ribosomal protection protein [Niameybacter massiliensis]|uniref:TetM/TetW/TetO/TetS family tetracycline resistance ribosomal protection protein n=1 Tax=Holtiella tumoricola TaxID=3018743 RepID=A0AA42J116_9FIRM|nr:TetM/TetW/TetO/TetS family tetracycline resistance ribosomal protection protein [Holtiella tumoricola]MDA3731870.1 TetM/TetW/TetO/TetS family tetracycline resistance ribosomal protection protein [Holtiella tumoricola]